MGPKTSTEASLKDAMITGSIRAKYRGLLHHHICHYEGKGHSHKLIASCARAPCEIPTVWICRACHDHIRRVADLIEFIADAALER